MTPNWEAQMNWPQLPAQLTQEVNYYSPDGTKRVVWQDDGNVVVYPKVQSTRTNNKPITSVTVTDGLLEAKLADGTVAGTALFGEWYYNK